MRVPRQYPRLLLAGGISAALAATLAGAPALAAQPGTTPGELDVDLVPVAVTGQVMFMNFDSFEGDPGVTHTEASVVLDDGRVFLVNDNVSDEDGLVAGAHIEGTLLIPAETAEALPAADQADLEELVAEATPEPANEAGIEALAVNEPAVDALLDAAAEEGGLYALSRDYNVLVDPYPAPTAANYNRVFDVAVITPDGTWEATDAEIRTMVEKTEQDWNTQTGKSFNWTVSEIKRLSTTITDAETYYSTLFNQAAKEFGHTNSDGSGNYLWYRSNAGRQLLVFLPGNEFTQPPGWGGVSMGLGQGIGAGGVVGLNFTAARMTIIAGNSSSVPRYLRTATHEMGHAMGLGHATSRTCANAPSTDTWSEAALGTCTVAANNDPSADYRDGYSVMGNSGLNINPTLRYELNLLDDSQVTVIDGNVTSQQVTLRSPTGTTGVLVLAVAGGDNGVDYLFEYRAIPSTDTVSSQVGGDGVRVIRLTTGHKTYFHESVQRGNSKLPVGGTFTSADGSIRVTLTSQDTSKAVLTVTRGGDECGDSTSAACSWTLNSTGTTTTTKGLQTAADQDYIRFTAPVSGSWKFESSAIPTGSDIYGYLLNSSGTQLAYNDDGAGNRNFLITYTLTAGSTYYLRVKNYSTTTSTPANPYTITATAPSAPPPCVVPTPTISGTKIAGWPLSAVVGTTTPSNATKTFQWYRGSTAISGATSSQYTLTAADAGQSVKVRVTCAASGYTSASADSAAYTIGVATLSVTPTSASLPDTASTTSAFTVTTNQPSWSLADNATWLSQTKGTSTFTATATANTSTTARTGTVTVSAGVATPVTVTVNQAGKDDCGSSTSSYCTWTLSATAASTITKRLEVAADVDYIRFTAPAAGSWTFQSSGIPTGSDIYGHLLNASGTELIANDDGAGNRNFKITFTLTANTVYFLKVRNYSATTTVTANPYTITASRVVTTVVVPTPTISGTKIAGWTLTASVGTLTPSTATKTYQWYRGSTAISGATSSTYTLKTADAGQAIKVRVTGTAPGYADGYADSAAYTVAAATLLVTPASASLPATASTTSAFTVTTNQPSWSVTDNASWLSETKSTSTFTATATANTSTTARTGTVTVSAGVATPVTVTVNQAAKDDCDSSTTAYCAWTLSAYASTSITKKLETAADVDYIRFTAPIAGSWTFKSSGIPTGSDIYGYLLNSSGTQLAYNDDGAGNRNFSITYTLTANTVYYLKVKNYSATTSTPANPYTITATLPGDECGQNLEDYCAWSLGTAGGTISKGLQYRGDEDYIRFTAPSSGSWTFTSSGIPTGSDIYGHLLNASGTQLTYNDDGAGNRNFKITYTLTAGSVYYLRVRNYSTGTSVPANPYTITATKG